MTKSSQKRNAVPERNGSRILVSSETTTNVLTADLVFDEKGF